MRVRSETSTKLGLPLAWGMVFLCVVLVLAIGCYLTVFNNGLSRSPDNWSAFGSFFGGVFSPLISIVTLFALIRTIGLQMDQNAHAVAESRNASVAAYRASQLQLLDQQINMYDRMIDRYDLEGERIFKLPREMLNRLSDLAQVDRNIEKVEGEISRLIKLSLDISLCEFESVAEIKNKMERELYSINPVLYSLNRRDV